MFSGFNLSLFIFNSQLRNDCFVFSTIIVCFVLILYFTFQFVFEIKFQEDRDVIIDNDGSLLLAGMNFSRAEDDSDVQQNQNIVALIDNPLPVPKRKNHTGMEFAIEVSDDDDFDINDLTNMDFYDI